MEECQLEQKLRELLLNSPGDFSELEEYLETVKAFYSGDADELAFRVAVRCECYDYVEEHIEDIELNDEEGFSTYLYETENSDILQLLMEHGAFRSWEDYGGCRFAMETVNGTILACDPDFLIEVLEKYLEDIGLTAEKAAAMLEKDYDPEEDDPVDARELRSALDSLHCRVKRGRLLPGDPIGDDCGWELKELIEDLGWDMEFEGDSWTLETLGVYFVE